MEGYLSKNYIVIDGCSNMLCDNAIMLDDNTMMIGENVIMLGGNAVVPADNAILLTGMVDKLTL